MTDLIKTARGLDQTGPGDDGQNLQLLWNSLVAASESQFHAAEESSLRWLLKSMNGTSPSAETLRRYPLTWTILDCVFQRIPLYSLAKSLADRKFIAVLQQTLKDVSKPVAVAASATPPKRKRSPSVRFDLGDLRSHHGCLGTSQELFKTLKALLKRLEISGEGFSRDRIGAEHIKSLFGTSATEATAIAAPALAICGNLLGGEATRDIEGAEDWIQTIARLWDLHLQAHDDVLEVANRLFRPAATILAKVGAFSSAEVADVPESLKNRWTNDLLALMHRNFILPGRAAFINQKSFEPFANALEVSKDIINVSGPALYFLSSTISGHASEGEHRKGNVEWIQHVFQAIEIKVRSRPDRSTLIQAVLSQAIQRSTSVNVHDLRRVCREYALQETNTDWSLVSKVATCDPDIFQLSDEGIGLRIEICRRTLIAIDDETERGAVLNVVKAMRDGFQTRRDFSSFLKLWFEQLCEAERQDLDSGSPWFKLAQQTMLIDWSTSWLEKEMSPSQLVGLLSWVEKQSSKAKSRSACVFTGMIAPAIKGEAFVDAVGRRLFDIVSPFKSSPATALKWRVTAATISWATPEERATLWDSVKDRLSKILKSSAIDSLETYEAFKCCCQAWDSMSPDGEHAGEAFSAVEEFTKRLADEAPSDKGSAKGRPFDVADATVEKLQLKTGHQPYLAWYLYGSSRYSRLHSEKKGELPPPLLNALATRKAGVDELRSLWNALVRNEVNLNDAKLSKDLADRLITLLDGSEKEKNWPGEETQLWIKTLTALPLDVYSRAQRESLMVVLSKRRARMVKSPKKVSLDGWRLFLGLATKMAGRPTFYEGMHFNDLVQLADAMSQVSVEDSGDSAAALELVERFAVMASATLRQMAENIDARSLAYFQNANDFLADCEKRIHVQKEAGKILEPLFTTLLKALVTELTRSPNCHNHEKLGPLAYRSNNILESYVMAVVNCIAFDKTPLASHDTASDLSLYAAVDGASAVREFKGWKDSDAPKYRKLEKRCKEAMKQGDLRGWKMQAFLRMYLSAQVEEAPPTTYDSLDKLPSQLRVSLLRELVTGVTNQMSHSARLGYLKVLLDEFGRGCDTDGQILAIEAVVEQLIAFTDFQAPAGEFSLAAAHSQLTGCLARTSANASHVCRLLRTLLEKRPQAMTQWNIELTLNTVCDLTSPMSHQTHVTFSWLCKLVEVVIKKHRLRLEGHYHILLSTLQALMQALIAEAQHDSALTEASQETNAHLYARLITLICEPTAGAVSRSQLHSALDSATDAAKRSAGRHMYLVLMQYAKLQLEENVPRAIREALEPAMNSIFDITTPEGRKILNDAMDASGRAILREMFKRYVKFGKWSGV
ncbi:Nucleolar 27S pre-rRNA processing protein [Purpureocillium lavendulum]|uniref:Nucleolar 27S pre-rRNA processing protein n=1 Tax=Purpureocillium lavendulum TaxID=1247861 RepID=A0AB34G4I7_9HYPO|nr:Nucleolar 27S pre-rRNA processing protein [Purpureocillium lavendulum]